LPACRLPCRLLAAGEWYCNGTQRHAGCNASHPAGWNDVPSNWPQGWWRQGWDDVKAMLSPPQLDKFNEQVKLAEYYKAQLDLLAGIGGTARL
jgi:hypothetical protein